MSIEESEYINAGPDQQRCNFVFLVDEDLNWPEKGGSVRVLSTRGKKCGVEKDPNGVQGYCYWHESNPDKAQDPELRSRFETAIRERVYLGGAFLSGGGPGTYLADSNGPLDLSGANLQGAHMPGAYLEGSILKGANLRESHLQSAWLGSADLSGADLTSARLQNTDFEGASLAGAELLGAHLNSASLVAVYWGDDYVLATEKRGRFDWAEEVYRTLKQHCRDSGDYRTAAEFYFREMECVRNQSNGITPPSTIPRISTRNLYSDGGNALRYNVVLNYLRAANASLSRDSPGVFLCHSSSDKPFARRLTMELVSNGVRVWLDEAEIGIGDSLLGKIESGISESKYLIIVLSRNSVSSSWCREELEMAMAGQIAERGIKVLPILTDDCEIPDALKEKKYADFREATGFDSAVAELCSVIQ